MRRKLLQLAAASASMFAYPASAGNIDLQVPVVVQQTPAWCWAATASMALGMLGFPDLNPTKNYQCGVVAAAFSQCQDDCTRCVTSLGSLDRLVGVLGRYSELSVELEQVAPTQGFDPNYVANPAWPRIKRSLDLSFPVIVGISPDERPVNPAEAQHTVLITGYAADYRGTGEDWVILRDPYPYDVGASPYAKAGFSIEASNGKTELPWRVLRDRMNLTSAIFLEKRSV